MKYKKKQDAPLIVDAVKWHKLGDGPHTGEPGQEVAIVTACPADQARLAFPCAMCWQSVEVHGFIPERKNGGHIVCPGDYIVTAGDNRPSACNPKYFLESFEATP